MLPPYLSLRPFPLLSSEDFIMEKRKPLFVFISASPLLYEDGSSVPSLRFAPPPSLHSSQPAHLSLLPPPCLRGMITPHPAPCGLVANSSIHYCLYRAPPELIMRPPPCEASSVDRERPSPSAPRGPLWIIYPRSPPSGARFSTSQDMGATRGWLSRRRGRLEGRRWSGRN